jgi:hypothetical protein
MHTFLVLFDRYGQRTFFHLLFCCAVGLFSMDTICSHLDISSITIDDSKYKRCFAIETQDIRMNVHAFAERIKPLCYAVFD